ncbi:MAG: DUF1804 family protein [Burkholderiales bacterium]|nr:DUF1804 family protein [Burkholderiales bacterium]
MNRKDKRAAARAAYVFEGLDAKTIERRLRAPSRTLYRWRKEALLKGDDWDAARAAMRLSSRGEEILAANVLEDFVFLFTATMNDVKRSSLTPMQKVETLSKLSDAYGKTTAAVRRSNPALSKLAVAMEVLDLLADFVRRRAPQGAPALLQVLEPFGAELAAKLQ